MGFEHFDKFMNLAERSARKKNFSLSALKSQGQKWVAEYEERGFLKMFPLEALKTEEYAWVPLIQHLLNRVKSDGRVPSPVEKYSDSNWMCEASFCFINVRGSGKSPRSHGDFINAAKLLPLLRTTSIHLAPFFECALEIIYGIDSLTIIDKNTVNRQFLKWGMTPDEQVRFFIDFAHLLGKTVGFDLEPHTSQFSRVAIENPQHFRWLKLDQSRERLAEGISQTEMLEPSYQAKLYREVESIKQQVINKYGLTSLEEVGKDELTKQAHLEVINRLIDAGLWTLPSHTWAGAGLPEFSHYKKKENYPEFRYLSVEGKEHRQHAFGILTPYRFYDHLPLNKVPTLDDPPVENLDTINFFSEIFPRLQKSFGFDFVRFDFADHIWDSILDKQGKLPISDRLTPYILKKTIAKARMGNKKYIGAMAERMGTDIELYSKVGFDLVLGDDVLKPISLQLIIDALTLNQKLCALNSGKKRKVSVQFAVDSHDMGHPLFKMTPMLKYGAKGVGLRQFVARFCGWGDAIRPKYEVLGNLDGTTGLYRANNRVCSIRWKSNRLMLNIYHNIEDLFEQLLPRLKRAMLVDYNVVHNQAIFWVLEDEKGLIIPVVNPDRKKSIEGIVLKGIKAHKGATVINPYTLEKKLTAHLILTELPPLECRLVLVEK